jgi:hypothetical protein
MGASSPFDGEQRHRFSSVWLAASLSLLMMNFNMNAKGGRTQSLS